MIQSKSPTSNTTQPQNGSASDRFQLTRHAIDIEIGRWRSRSVVAYQIVQSALLIPEIL